VALEGLVAVASELAVEMLRQLSWTLCATRGVPSHELVGVSTTPHDGGFGHLSPHYCGDVQGIDSVRGAMSRCIWSTICFEPSPVNRWADVCVVMQCN
jgi:hypothetical protein